MPAHFLFYKKNRLRCMGYGGYNKQQKKELRE